MRRFLGIAGAAAVPIAAAIIVLALVAGGDKTTWSVRATPFPETADVVTDGGAVPFLLAPPLGGPFVNVWTGHESLLFTGVPADGVEGEAGARYSPEVGRWETIPAPPFEHRLASVDGTWSGDELVIGGVACENRAPSEAEELHCFPGTVEFAAFNPDASSWSKIPTLPVAAFSAGNGGTWGSLAGVIGQRAIVSVVVPQENQQAQKPTQYWALDLESRKWERLPDRPFSSYAQNCVVGDTLIAAGPRYGEAVVEFDPTDGGRLGIYNYDGVTVATLSVSGIWENGPELSAPLSSGNFPSVLCGNDYALVFSKSLDRAWSYDPRQRAWAEIAAAPEALRSRAPHPGPAQTPGPIEFRDAAATGTGFVFWNPDTGLQGPSNAEGHAPTAARPGNAIVLDAATQTWSSTEPAPVFVDRERPHSAAWFEGSGVLVDADGRGAVSLVLYRPAG